MAQKATKALATGMGTGTDAAVVVQCLSWRSAGGVGGRRMQSRWAAISPGAPRAPACVQSPPTRLGVSGRVNAGGLRSSLAREDILAGRRHTEESSIREPSPPKSFVRRRRQALLPRRERRLLDPPGPLRSGCRNPSAFCGALSVDSPEISTATPYQGPSTQSQSALVLLRFLHGH